MTHNDTAQRMQDFVSYWRTLRGDEKGESQVFLDRLFQALGHAGSPLHDAQERLDAAVRAAYGMSAGADILGFLLALNGQLAAAEARGEGVTGPGLPAGFNPADFTTADAVRPLVGGTATGGGA